MSAIKNSKFIGFEDFYKKHSTMASTNCIQYRGNENRCVEMEIEMAVEETIPLIINEKHRVNILTSPQQLEALAVGYLICEGLIRSFEEIERVECKEDGKIWINTSTSFDNFVYWMEIRTSGCIGIKFQYENLDTVIDSDIQITPSIIFKAQKEVIDMSKIWPISGGTHSSGLFRANGELAYFSEDVGRHNTFDKIIGEAAINGEDLSKLICVTSGRISAAMVSKLVRPRIPILISNTAPMAQGLEIARKAHMTIVGFSRDPVFKVYSNKERIVLP
ncbi:MAG: formate dehydrogenase accessory sulfurtransferase FdhD [Candidatus Hodarchaeota archaeon]